MSDWKLHYKNGKVRWYQNEFYDEEKDNFIWHDILEYAGYSKGSSSCNIYFKSNLTQTGYYMFMTDFNYIVKKLDHGIIEGDFTFCKRGANYGIKLV